MNREVILEFEKVLSTYTAPPLPDAVLSVKLQFVTSPVPLK